MKRWKTVIMQNKTEVTGELEQADQEEEREGQGAFGGSRAKSRRGHRR